MAVKILVSDYIASFIWSLEHFIVFIKFALNRQNVS